MTWWRGVLRWIVFWSPSIFRDQNFSNYLKYSIKTDLICKTASKYGGEVWNVAKLQRFLSGNLKTDTAGVLIFFLTKEDYNWSDSWNTKLLWIFWWYFPVHKCFERPLIQGKIIASFANVSGLFFISSITRILFTVIQAFSERKTYSGYFKTRNKSTNLSEDLHFTEGQLEAQDAWTSDCVNVKGY